MMSSSEVEEIRIAGNEIQDELSVRTRMLNKIESDRVNLQCVRSSDFMVGKQTNFNGPVTIINYADGNDLQSFGRRDADAEEMVDGEKTAPLEMAPASVNFSTNNSGAEKPEKMQVAETKDGDSSHVKFLCMRNFLKIPVFAWSLILFIVLAGCVTLAIELSEDKHLEQPETFPGEKRNYTLYSRKHWRAADEKSSVEMKLPVPYLIISNSKCDPCSGLRDCGRVLRDQQFFQKKKSESDIYSNFLVSSDGSVYEGRGWNKRNAFLGFPNSQSLEVSFMGDFTGREKPSAEQVEAAKAFIQFALTTNKLGETYRLVPANATGISLPEESSAIGANLYRIVKNWPRFTPDPYLQFFPFPSVVG